MKFTLIAIFVALALSVAFWGVGENRQNLYYLLGVANILVYLGALACFFRRIRGKEDTHGDALLFVLDQALLVIALLSFKVADAMTLFNAQ